MKICADFAKFLVLVVCMLLTGVACRAEGNVSENLGPQQLIEKAVEQCRQIIRPFSEEAGFPAVLPASLKGKLWKEIHTGVAKNCAECATIMQTLVDKHNLPLRQRLGAMYFSKSFMLETRIFPLPTAADSAHEIKCGDFAGSCDMLLKEMKLWAMPDQAHSYDMVWAQNTRDGLERIKSMLPTFTHKVANAEARKIYKDLAAKTIDAGNEAGMVANRVGSFGFPAWRLRFAVKYFKAAALEAVAGVQDKEENDENYWQQACGRLKKAIEPLPRQIDALLNSLP